MGKDGEQWRVVENDVERWEGMEKGGGRAVERGVQRWVGWRAVESCTKWC